MNSRFKFRVWDKRLKEYNQVHTYCLFEDGDLGEYDDVTPVREWFIIEQCTGLKDKNGNLIYEGDIIHEVDKEADIDDISQIVWSQYTCHFMKLDLPETGLDRQCILCEDDSPYIEIIGNIHDKQNKRM